MSQIGNSNTSAIVHDFFEVLGKTGNVQAKLHNYKETGGYDHIMKQMMKSMQMNMLQQVNMQPGSAIRTLLESVAHSQALFHQQTLQMIEDLLGPSKKGPGGCK